MCNRRQRPDITELLQWLAARFITVLVTYEQRRDTPGPIPLQQVQRADLRRPDLVSHPGGRRVLVVQLDQFLYGGLPVLALDRPGHQYGVSPAAHAPRLQDLPSVRIFPRGLRHADARRRADLLGRDAPHSPSALGPGARSAYAARERLLGAHRLDPVRRGASQR